MNNVKFGVSKKRRRLAQAIETKALKLGDDHNTSTVVRFFRDGDASWSHPFQ